MRSDYIVVLTMVVLFNSIGLHANELPDMPTPKVKSVEVAYPHPPVRFWDRPAKIAAVATVTLLAADSAFTCRNLARGGHEDWGPQSCRKMVTSMALERVGLWGAAYVAHRHGWHKAERVLEWFGPLSNGAGLAYSAKNGGL